MRLKIENKKCRWEGNCKIPTTSMPNKVRSHLSLRLEFKLLLRDVMTLQALDYKTVIMQFHSKGIDVFSRENKLRGNDHAKVTMQNYARERPFQCFRKPKEGPLTLPYRDSKKWCSKQTCLYLSQVIIEPNASEFLIDYGRLQCTRERVVVKFVRWRVYEWPM